MMQSVQIHHAQTCREAQASFAIIMESSINP